jgi:hypothetical protein
VCYSSAVLGVLLIQKDCLLLQERLHRKELCVKWKLYSSLSRDPRKPALAIWVVPPADQVSSCFLCLAERSSFLHAELHNRHVNLGAAGYVHHAFHSALEEPIRSSFKATSIQGSCHSVPSALFDPKR